MGEIRPEEGITLGSEWCDPIFSGVNCPAECTMINVKDAGGRAPSDLLSLPLSSYEGPALIAG